eukprot:g1814.t1
MPATSPKLLSLVYLREGTRVLLGYKKRGFGANKWNGFGGKREGGESMERCARRELQEEAGIEVARMEFRGRCHYRYQTLPRPLEVHVYEAYDIVGGAVAESDEMRPEWFEASDVPVDKMWADDPYWLPQLLQDGGFGVGRVFEASFLFRRHEGEDSSDVLEHDVRVACSEGGETGDAPPVHA